MAFNRYTLNIALRVVAMFVTLAVLAWIVISTNWYVTMILVACVAAAEIVAFARFTAATNREIARFLDAIVYDDATQTFGGLRRDSSFRELGTAMAGVVERLRQARGRREEQARYLQTLLAHIPVALLAVDGNGAVQLLNGAARRLFDGNIATLAEFTRFGADFAGQMAALGPGQSALVRMERPAGPTHLKAAATEFAGGGSRRRLISLANIESELNAQELMAWQSVIRVMAHEMMNSLTPVSSLSATAQQIVGDVRDALPAGSEIAPQLADAHDALETVARRSEALLHFVQNYRRLTKRMVAEPELLPVRRLFTRLERLFASDLAHAGIALIVTVSPEALEVAADAELMEQALINLLRNAKEALKGTPSARIVLFAHRDVTARVAIGVRDNGPGIPPEHRDKIFVPFFTTKREGSGVGLTLTRQIAQAHGASMEMSDAPGGGAVLAIRF